MNLIFKQSVTLIITITVTMTSLYIVANNLPILAGSFRYAWAPISLIGIFLVCSSVYKTKEMLYLMLYGILSLGLLQYTLWKHMLDWHRMAFLNEFYALFVFASIFFYFYVRKDFSGLAILSKLSFYFIIITLVMTNIALFLDPMIVRRSATPDTFTAFQAKIFKHTGATGYGYAQALVLLIPILVYHIKFKLKLIFPRRVLIIVLLVILITLIRAQVLANVLAAAVIMAVSFAGVRSAAKSFTILAVVSIVLLLIPMSIYADLIYFVSSFFDPDSLMYSKLRDLAFFVQFPEYDFSTEAGGRASRYPFLFDAFFRDPIFGAASNSASFSNDPRGMWNHLYWMYKLAIWGLPGFIFFIFVLYQLYKRISSIFDADFRFYYFLSVFAFILLGLMKNIAGREPFLILIVVIPGLYFLPLLEQRQQTKIRVTA
ncbi:MAG: hypothetical protein RBR67_16890 [Desulfobacterium sp.]|nr:hypothetical protein [Desulfobacterium sp.]